MRKLTIALALLPALLTLGASMALAATDAETEGAITSTLVDKLGSDASTIRVAFHEGKATLSGHVAEKATQELAEQVALYVPGVKKVENEIDAENSKGLLRGKLGGESEDATLESSVKKALKGEVGSTADKIEVEACDGAVSIRGTVPDKARHDLAVAAATKTKGVSKVVDLLRTSG
jgi:osmotically-inducible protein OsmY